MRRAARSSLAVLALLVAGCGSSDAVDVPDAPTGGVMQIEVELPRRDWTAGDALPALVRIRNTGAQASRVPDPQSNVNGQPIYTLRGPGHEAGTTVSLRQVVLGDDGSALSPDDMDLVDLAPGAAHEAPLALNDLFRFAQPGTYTLVAALDWEGASVQSQPLEIHVRRPEIRSAAFVGVPGATLPSNLRVFCLGGATGLRVATFAENQTTDVVNGTGVSPFATAGEGVSEVFAAWTVNADMGAPSPRCGWRAGRTLGLADFREDGGATIDLEFEPRIIHPALDTADGSTDVFVIDDADSRLVCIRFPAAGAGAVLGRIDEPDAPLAEPDGPPPQLDLAPPEPPKPRLLWSAPLGGRVLAATASLAPRDGDGSRAAFLLVRTEAGVEATLFTTGADGGAPGVVSALLEKGTDVPGHSTPALRLDGKGGAEASFLSGAGGALALVTASFGSANEASAGPAWEFVGPVRAAAVAHSMTPGAAGRRDWIVVQADGTVVSSGAPDEPQSLDGEPVLPLQLLGMDDHRYLLTTSPDGVLQFTRLR